jgi:hypothetical protein|tara:strand:- start:1180 stop:3441 length:2262 start_codon:yes stop_codon:yes gene_type:complete
MSDLSSQRTFADRADEKKRREEFEFLKSHGQALLDAGEIDEKQFNAATRQGAIDFGLLAPDEYPQGSRFIKPATQILGGVAGALAGTPGGPGAVPVGAGLGAGLGTALGENIDEYFYPNLPRQPKEDLAEEMLTTGAVDAALTAAIPMLGGAGLRMVGKGATATGKGVTETGRKWLNKAQDKLPEGAPKTPTRAGVAGFVDKALGVDENANALATKLAEKYGIEMSLGQASSSPFVQAIYQLTSRMPVVGRAGSKQFQRSFDQIDAQLQKFTRTTEPQQNPFFAASGVPGQQGTLKTVSEMSGELEGEILENLAKRQGSYTAKYQEADRLMAARGDFFDVAALTKVADEAFSKGDFSRAAMPGNLKRLLNELRPQQAKPQTDALSKKYRFAAPSREAAKPLQPIEEVNALESWAKNIRDNYDPTKSGTKDVSTAAYRTANAIVKELQDQRLKQTGEAGRLHREAHNEFGQYMDFLQTRTGKAITGVSGAAKTRGVGLTDTAKNPVEELLDRVMGTNKSPEAVRELRGLVSPRTMQNMAAHRLDDLFTKHIKSDKKDFTALFDELGFGEGQKRGLAYETSRELFKDFDNVSLDELEWFLGALKEYPEMLPDINQFVLRSGALRAAGSIGPTMLTGAAGFGAGGGLGAAAGMGLMWGLNSFLARPFARTVGKDMVDKGLNALSEAQKKNFLTQFTQFLKEMVPDVPQNVPVGALAAQPFVPTLTEDVQGMMNPNVPMLSDAARDALSGTFQVPRR